MNPSIGRILLLLILFVANVIYYIEQEPHNMPLTVGGIGAAMIFGVFAALDSPIALIVLVTSCAYTAASLMLGLAPSDPSMLIIGLALLVAIALGRAGARRT